MISSSDPVPTAIDRPSQGWYLPSPIGVVDHSAVLSLLANIRNLLRVIALTLAVLLLHSLW